MKIAIASDYVGFELKTHVKEYLQNNKGYEVKNYSPFINESSYYPDHVHSLSLAVENERYDLGLSMCDSRNGINIIVNKLPGNRSALCWNIKIAEFTFHHNNATICALPTCFISTMEAKEIIDIFSCIKFKGGRHKRRNEKFPIQ